MVLENIIKKVYQMILKGISLTYLNMLGNGLNDDEIDILIGNNIIGKKSKLKFNDFDIYQLVNVSDFRKYGIYLLNIGKVRDALTCFEMCYQLEPRNKEICMQYLLMQLKKKNYEEVINTFRQLENVSNLDTKFNNLILYLLNCVTKLPKEYEDRILCFDLEDIFDINCNDELVLSIYNSKFKYAYELINDMLSKNYNYSISLELIKELLKQIFNKNDNIMESIKRNIEKKEYDRVVAILRNVQTRRKLTYIETYIILICDAIVKIKETSIIPKVYEAQSLEMFDLLINNDFKKALRTKNKFNKGGNDIISSLLVELNYLIEKVKKNNFEQDNQYENFLKSAYGYICLFNEENISIEEGCKKHSVGLEISLLIRIIYAKDNYDEDSRKMFYDELRQGEYIPSSAIRLLDEIENEEKNYRKVKVPVKKRYRIRHFDGKKELRTSF